MAGIKQPILDLLTKLQTITVRNGDGNMVTPHVRIWNNQIAYSKEGKLPSFPCPAFFVEVVNNPTYELIGQGFRSCDIAFKVHICHEFYDAQDGTFEQDLVVFDLRDQVVANLTGFKLTACGPLNSMSETQDFEHDNLYHMIIDFVCNFTDSIGSKFDAGNPNAYLSTTPPTTLEVDVTKTFIIN